MARGIVRSIHCGKQYASSGIKARSESWSGLNVLPMIACGIVSSAPGGMAQPIIVMEPLELLERLSALVPAPRAHLTRYAGVLAPAAKWRSLIVPQSQPPNTAGHRRRYRDIRLRAGLYGDSGSNWRWRIAAGTLSAWP